MLTRTVALPHAISPQVLIEPPRSELVEAPARGWNECLDFTCVVGTTLLGVRACPLPLQLHQAYRASED
eukprot:4823629-Amphidinium_carterae.1